MFAGRPLAAKASLRSFAVGAAFAVSLAFVPVASAASCPNAALRGGPSASLPDCRAYEMVSPPFKNGGGTGLESDGVSPDGEALMLGSLAAFAGQEGNLGSFTGSFYSIRRTEAGWVTVPENPPASQYTPNLPGGGSSHTSWSVDLRTSVWAEQGVTRPDNSIDLYIRHADGSIADIGPVLPPSAPSGLSLAELGTLAEVNAIGTSDDGSHVLFDLHGALRWPFDGTAPNGPSLYEYVGTANTTPMLVGVDNAGHLISECGTTLGSGLSGATLEASHHAMSPDGSTVFFTAYPGCGGIAPRVAEVFARIDNGMPDAHTVAISEPSAEDCSACDTGIGVLAGARFEAASQNGSRVFFVTGQPLLDGSGGVYEYDFGAPAGERLRLIGPGGGVVQVSEDGSHVYFTSSNVLGAASNEQGQEAQPGAANLYVNDTETGATEFIADGEVGSSNVTPDGRFLVFTSRSDLTPDDTSATQQVFEYDTQTGALVRVSVGQAGFNDNGNAACVPFQGAGSCIDDINIAVGNLAPYSTVRSVSADGQYVFFQSPEALTPQALADQLLGFTSPGSVPIYANNVYEYHHGVVSLISDGRDVTASSAASNVSLVGTDTSGRDVFFTTADSLTPQDSDDNADIYDARIDGGFPAPATPLSCTGDACQGELSAAPTLLSPGSEFQAGGNPPQPASTPIAAKPEAKKAHAKAKAKARGKAKGKAKAKQVSGKRKSKRKAKQAATQAPAKRRRAR